MALIPTNRGYGELEQQTDSSPEGETIVAPERFIRDVGVARSMYAKWRADHLRRINLYKEIRGLIQGEPPYNPKELADAGLQHVSNINDMSARASFERQCLAYWNLLYSSERIIQFKINIKDPTTGRVPPETTKWAEIMAKNWDYVIKTQWPSFLVNVATLCSQLVELGVSPVLFPDERSPKWRVVEMNRFFVPNQAQADLDMLTSVMVETEFTIQYLFQTYKKEKAKEVQRGPKTSPWNVEELGRLIYRLAAAPARDLNAGIDYLDIENQILSNDYSMDKLYNDSVRLISLFQREYNGKITHYMFHRTRQETLGGAGGAQANPAEDFLFILPDQYNAMSEALVLFTMNPGEFTIHMNRGLGHKIYSLAQAKIMMDNSVIDMGRWSATPIIKSPSLGQKDVEQIRIYPGVITNIGTAELQQNTLGANVQNVVSVAQYLAGQIQYNINYSGSDPSTPDPDKGSLSPDQIKLMAYREYNVLKNNISHFYNTFDRLLSNMVSTMLRAKEIHPDYELSRAWMELCLEDGVPQQIFDIAKAAEEAKQKKNNKYIPRIVACASRAAGAGSQMGMLLGLEQMRTIAGAMGPREEKEMKRMTISAAFGPEYVETFMQDSDTVDEQAGGASLAAVENAIMEAGKSPVFSLDNEHRSHAAIHMAELTGTIQKIQQGQMSPIEADSIFNVAVPHTGEHIQALARSPFSINIASQLKGPYEQIARYAQLNRKNAAKMLQAQQEQQQQAAAEQQQTMTSEQIKNMQAINEERRKDMKLAAQSERQQRAGEVKESMLQQKVMGELALKRRETEGKIEIQKKKAFLENTADESAQENPSKYLQELNGVTPAPYDIEGSGPPTI